MTRTLAITIGIPWTGNPVSEVSAPNSGAAAVVDKAVTVLRSVVNRGLSRSGNAIAVETLAQTDGESGSIRLLALITVDMFAGWMDHICVELQDVLPAGSNVSRMGSYEMIDRSERGSAGLDSPTLSAAGVEDRGPSGVTA